jgi:hypothetical protein
MRASVLASVLACLFGTGCAATTARDDSAYDPFDTGYEWTAGDYAIDTAGLYAWTWVWTYATDENFRDGLESLSFDRWWDNVSQAPVWDDDSSDVTNNVYHPLAGAFYYEYMRARGYPRLVAASQTLLQSVLFEYTIEGLYTRPSAQDLVKTTAIGVPLGIGADEAARALLRSDSTTQHVLGYLLNPMYLLPFSRWKGVRAHVSFLEPGLRIVVDF